MYNPNLKLITFQIWPLTLTRSLTMMFCPRLVPMRCTGPDKISIYAERHKDLTQSGHTEAHCTQVHSTFHFPQNDAPARCIDRGQRRGWTWCSASGCQNAEKKSPFVSIWKMFGSAQPFLTRSTAPVRSLRPQGRQHITLRCQPRQTVFAVKKTTAVYWVKFAQSK